MLERARDFKQNIEKKAAGIFKERERFDNFAVVFPGQGGLKPGIGKELYEAHQIVRDYAAVAEELLGVSITKLSWNSTKEELVDTRINQLLTFFWSHANYAVWEKQWRSEHWGKRPTPKYFAGDSLGQINALVVAGAIGFEEALKFVVVRGMAMHDACEQSPSSLLSLTVVDGDEEGSRQLDSIRHDLNFEDRGLYKKSDSSESQIVVGCSNFHLYDIYEKYLKNFDKVRVIRLPVEGAFHTPLMDPAVPAVEEILEEITVQKTRTPVIDNTSNTKLRSPKKIKKALIDHVTKPVEWAGTMKLFEVEGLDVIEINDKPLLTKMVKKQGIIEEIRDKALEVLEDNKGKTAIAVGGLTVVGAIAFVLVRNKNKDKEK
ncbi:MAG: ACP S-malonyltransferase [Patescibacteria group bacterium]